MTLYFIYGTLRQGQYNHKRFDLDKHTICLGSGELEGFGMHMNQFCDFPEIVPNPNFTVHGELVMFNPGPKSKEVEKCCDEVRKGVYLPLPKSWSWIKRFVNRGNLLEF